MASRRWASAHRILFLASVAKSRRRFARAIGRARLRQREALGRIHREVLLRRDVRRVRPVEPDPEEERFLRVRANRSSSLTASAAPMPSVCSASSPSSASQLRLAPELAGDQREDPVVNLAIAAPRVHRDVPRRPVVEARGADVVRHAVVIELPDPRRDPAGGLEALRQRHRVRNGVADAGRQPVPNRVGHDLRRVRLAPGEKGRPAGIAQRKLTVGAVEPRAARRQPVDVRRLRAATVAAEIVVQDRRKR